MPQLGEATKEGKLLATATGAGKFADDFFSVVGFYFFVDFLLLGSHVGVLHVGNFLRKVLGHLRLESSQNKGLDHRMETSCFVLVVLLLDGLKKLLFEDQLVAQ